MAGQPQFSNTLHTIRKLITMLGTAKKQIPHNMSPTEQQKTDTNPRHPLPQNPSTMNPLVRAHALPQGLILLKRLITLGLLAMSVPLLHANEGAGQKIRIDGDVDDWKPIPPVVASAQSPPTENKKEVDVSQLKVSNDDENLYLYIAASAPPLTAIEGQSGISQGVFVVYLDTDGDITTGCKDLDLHGANGRKVSGFDLQLVVSVGRIEGSTGTFGAMPDGPFAEYNSYAPRNGSFSFRDRKWLKEQDSCNRNPLVALCPIGIELAVPLKDYQIKSGAKIRLLIHKMGSMKHAVYSEGSYQITPAQ